MKNMQLTLGLALALVLLGVVGCRDKNKAEADKAIQVMRHSFDQAAENLRGGYQALTLALESNDLVKAKAEFDKLSQAALSPEQQQAVAEKKQELMLKLSAALQKGDTNSANMIQELRTRSRSR